jgi:hypothetical protein
MPLKLFNNGKMRRDFMRRLEKSRDDTVEN